MRIALRPENPVAWTEFECEDLFALDRQEREELQLEAIQLRFAQLRDKIPALQKLADKQGVHSIDSFDDALRIAYDHRVLKNYPLHILENRDFAKLTSWLNKLTVHDLSQVDLTGLATLDDWIARLEAFGMIIATSSGTTGKLSFVARSKEDISGWRNAMRLTSLAATGVDSRKVKLPVFSPGYRSGNQMSVKKSSLFAYETHGGPENRFTLYDQHMSTDLLALAGKLRGAEERGDVEQLGLDPALVEQRRKMIEAGRRRDADVQVFFERLIDQFRGKQVSIAGLFADLYRVAQAGMDKGLKCDFAPGSVISCGGGMKGYKGAPDNWQEIIKEFFGVERLSTYYGFSEMIGAMPMCSHGYYHVFPYTVPMLLGSDGQPLPREGAQTGRMAVFDLLAQSCWGGFVTGDEVTVHFDDDCECGWRTPRLGQSIRRYSEMEGGDDKITCSGTVKAYDEFMEFVMGQG